MNGAGWQLFRWQSRGVILPAMVSALALASATALVPERYLIPFSSATVFALGLLLALKVVAPQRAGATAHLLVCGFSRKQVWRQMALAAVAVGILCGLGAAIGANTVVRHVVNNGYDLPAQYWGPADTVRLLIVLGMAVAGVALGLWTGVRMVHAAPGGRLRIQIESMFIAVAAIAATGAALKTVEDDRFQMAVIAAVFLSAGVVLWLSRRLFARVEPLHD